MRVFSYYCETSSSFNQMYIYSVVAGHLRLTLYNLVEIIFLEQKGIYLGFFDQYKNC